jgi:ABC-2 type transport system permease protein
MKNILKHIIKKEFIQFRNDKKMIGMSIIAPVIQLLLLGYAANIDIKNISLTVCDYDKSAVSREYVRTLTNSDYFSVEKYVDNMSEIDGEIDNGRVSVGLVIPADFGKNVRAGKTVEIQSLVDGSDSNTATIGMNYLGMLTNAYSQKFLIKKMERLKSVNINPQVINAQTRIWYNPELKSRNFMVPGVLGLLLMVMTLILTSLAIVKEKESGTLEQLIVTPIKPFELILGKLIPFTVVGMVDIIIVLLMAGLWFRVPIRGNIILLFIFSMIFLISTLGMGLFISTITQNQQQAMMASVFFLIMPMTFLSGFVFPIENMPYIVQLVTYAMPLRYYFIIVRGLFLKGVGFSELWDETLILLLIGIVIFAISVMRFKKRVE